jgi:hypothetical protein
MRLFNPSDLALLRKDGLNIIGMGYAPVPFCSAPTLASLSATRATASISSLAVTGTRTTATAADSSVVSVGDIALDFTSDSSIVQQNWTFTSKVSTAADLSQPFGVSIQFIDTITNTAVASVFLALRTITSVNTGNAIIDDLGGYTGADVEHDNIAVSAGYQIALAINTADGTTSYKDSAGRSGSLKVNANFNNSHPIVGVVVYNTGTTLNDSIVGDFNQGSQAFTVQIASAVSHCNSVAYSGFLPSQLSGIVAWYDPYDLSTMFTDIAGTTNVTASGDPVGKMLDKSGNGHHIVASLDARRPIYTVSGAYKFLDFDGTDDCLFSSDAIDMTSTNDVSVCTAVTADVNATSLILETSANYFTNNGSFAMIQNGLRFDFANRGTAASVTTDAEGGAITIPATKTLIGIATIGDYARMIMNGVETTAPSNATGTGNYGNHVLYIGARNNSSLRFNGKIYGTFFTNTTMSAAEILAAQTYLDAKHP